MLVLQEKAELNINEMKHVCILYTYQPLDNSIFVFLPFLAWVIFFRFGLCPGHHKFNFSLAIKNREIKWISPDVTVDLGAEQERIGSNRSWKRDGEAMERRWRRGRIRKCGANSSGLKSK